MFLISNFSGKGGSTPTRQGGISGGKYQNSNFAGICLVIGICILAGIGVAAFNGHLFETSFSDLSDDSEYYNARALSLMETGTLGEGDTFFRRPPGYSFFLAAVYIVLGKHIISAWIAHIILFAITLFLLWRISDHIVSGWFALAPPLFFGLYTNFYVFEIGSELFAGFLLLLLIFLYFRYHENTRIRHILSFGFAGGILALTKPVTLYALPILLGGVIYVRHSAWRKRMVLFSVGLLSIVLMVGGWMVRNYLMYGEIQSEQIGHIVYTRALYGTLSWQDIGTHIFASATGDYVADAVAEGYSDNSVAQRLAGMRITEKARLQKQEGHSSAVAEQMLLERGIDLALEHPLKFTIGSVPLLLDLNTPENGRGFPVTRMFVGTYEHIPAWMKIVFLLGIRLIWYIFLTLAVVGMVISWIQYRSMALPLVFLIIYFNLVHAFLIIPAEPRFIMPILPFYFLFFVVGNRAFVDKFFRKSII